MRLTLRTLLAYLDDRLAPAHARELGLKVAKSPFATELADRIRDVLRRRRLAQEIPGQKIIDANLVAEYLDDQLTPELVALIEKEILSSDQSLAEVAASHQILGLLSDPVEISDALKQRLRKLDPAAVPDERDPSVAASSATVEWKPLTPQTVQSNRSPLALLMVMVLGWLALLASDSHLFPSRSNAVDESGDRLADIDQVNLAANDDPLDVVPPPVDPTDRAVPLVDGSSTTPKTPSPPSNETAMASTTGTASPSDQTTEGSPAVTTAEQTPPSVVTNVDTNTTTAVTPTGPMEAAVASVTDVSVNPPPGSMPMPADGTSASETVTPTDTATVATVPVRVELRDEHGMLMVTDQQEKSWIWGSALGVPPGGNWNLSLSSRIAGVTEPFSVALTAPDAGWRALVLGSSLFRTSSTGVAGIEMIEGRLILTRIPAEDPQPLSLLVGGKELSIGLPPDTNRIGIEVVTIPDSAPPTSATDENIDDVVGTFSLLPSGHACRVSIFAAESHATVAVNGAQPPTTIALGGQLIVTTNSEQPPKLTEPSVTATPEWIFQSSVPPAEATQSMIAAIAQELRAEESIAGGVNAVAANRNPEVAAYAVKIPALTRQVNELCSFLIQSEQETVRREAIIGLQHIVRQGETGLVEVEAAMSNRLSNIELESAMRLLGGITPTAAEDRSTSLWLVDMLSSNRLALRALAIFTLEDLVNERFGYFAGDDSGRRDPSVRRWKRLLDRNDGRLIKAP